MVEMHETVPVTCHQDKFLGLIYGDDALLTQCPGDLFVFDDAFSSCLCNDISADVENCL